MTESRPGIGHNKSVPAAAPVAVNASKPLIASGSTIPSTSAPDHALSVAAINNAGLVLSSAAWPLAVAFVAVLFKAEIAAFFERLTNFKGFGFEASLDTYIKKTLDQPITLPPPPETGDVPPGKSDTLSSLSPSEIILTSWMKVEKELNNVLGGMTPNAGGMSMQTRLSLLGNINNAPTGLRSRITELNNIRNRISKLPNGLLSGESIKLFQENADQASRDLAALVS